MHAAQPHVSPLTAASMLLLLARAPGALATVARVALVCWVAWFSAFDAVTGLATGVLAGETEAADVVFADVLVGGEYSLLGWVVAALWTVVAVTGGLTLRRAGARRVTYGAMVASLPIVVHAGPAALGFLALAVAVRTGVRARPDVTTEQVPLLRGG